MIQVAYLYTTPHFSGAAVSLVQVLNVLGAAVHATVLTPRGSAEAYFQRAGVGRVHGVSWLSQFDHTRFGRYRGARWLVALRELLMLPITWLEVRRFAQTAGAIDLIHLNEITGILPALMLKRRLGVPLVVHVRANMGEQSRGWRSRWLWQRFERHVDAVICIDDTVRRTVPAHIRCEVIHNALNLAAPVPSATPLPEALTQPGRVKVGIVGSLLQVKGVYEFLEAAIRLCRQREDLVFFLVGKGVRRLAGVRGAIFSALGLAEDVEQRLREGIAAAGLQDRIVMMGHREDVQAIYQALDILCFPSYYDAPGRPIFEAAYFGKPSIVAIDDPCPDTLVDGVTGIAIPARDPAALAAAIERLADDPARRHEMGEAARALARRNFDLPSNAAQVRALYERLLPAARRVARPEPEVQLR